MITLKKPIEVEGKTYEALDFDPTLDMLETFEAELAKVGDDEKAQTRLFKALIAQACEVPPALVGQLRMSDMRRLQEAAGVGEAPLPSRQTAGASGDPTPPTSPTS